MRLKDYIIATLLLASVATSATAKNLSTNKDSAIASVRGRILSPKYGRFSFMLDQELRSTDRFGVFNDSRTSIFLGYTPLEWLKVSGGYLFMAKEGSGSATLKNRYILALEGKLALSNIRLSLRERMESITECGYLLGDEAYSDPVNRARTRLKVSYSNGEHRVTPYIYNELYNRTDEGMMLSRVRVQGGADYKLSRSSKLTAYYQYTHFVNEPQATAPHTVGVLYTHQIVR